MNNIGTYLISDMVRITLLALIFVCSGCLYPRYVGQMPKTYIKNRNFLSSQDTLFVDEFYFSATRRKNTGLNQTYEIVSITEDIEQALTESIKHPNIYIRALKNKSQIEGLEGKKIKRKHLENALSQLFTEGYVLLPIINYYVRYEAQREAGGPIGFSSATGNDSHIIKHELVIALYRNSEIVFLNSKARINQVLVPAGTPITHEFPQAVLDSLMHMALEPLLKQIDKKNAAKRERK